jgi:hypothetical protein
MRITRSILFSLVAALPLAGCLLISGQFIISVNLLDGGPVVVTNPGVVPLPVDLTTNSTYNDHKGNLKDISDVALLGELTNTGSSAATVDFYMTRDATTYTTASQVLADPTVVKVWGTLTAAPGETKRINWDDSAGLFVGRQELLQEVQGDGKFTLYGIGTAGASATIHDGVLVLVVEAGI